MVLLARGVVRWVGGRGLGLRGVAEVKGRKAVGVDGVVGRMKAAAAVVALLLKGLLRMRAKVPRMAAVPSMVVRKRRRLDEDDRRRMQRWAGRRPEKEEGE